MSRKIALNVSRFGSQLHAFGRSQQRHISCNSQQDNKLTNMVRSLPHEVRQSRRFAFWTRKVSATTGGRAHGGRYNVGVGRKATELRRRADAPARGERTASAVVAGVWGISGAAQRGAEDGDSCQPAAGDSGRFGRPAAFCGGILNRDLPSGLPLESLSC